MERQTFMRVMVSLNLADIMTSTRPTTPKPAQETPNNEADPGQGKGKKTENVTADDADQIRI